MSFFLNEKRHPRDVCAGCATLKAFAATSAQAAQLPKHLPRHLRRLRRSQSICHDIGAGCATPKALAATSAQVAQLPKHLPRRLRRLRRSQSIGRGISDISKAISTSHV